MAIICLKVPIDVAKTLENINVPGNHVPDREKHVTLQTLGKLGVPLPLEMVGKTISAIAQATDKFKPFHVEVLGYGTPFQRTQLGIPIVCHVKSNELHELHSLISTSLDNAGIAHFSFPQFRPHITLSWGQVHIEDHLFKTPLVWTVNRIMLWCGAFGDERIHTVFELMG